MVGDGAEQVNRDATFASRGVLPPADAASQASPARLWRGPARAPKAAGFTPRALVIALGVDAAAGDPESPLAVTADGFRAAGHALGVLGLPTVVVQEGGYDVATIGPLVRAALEGLAAGQHEEGMSG